MVIGRSQFGRYCVDAYVYALVVLMTVPGLALFYGGLVKKETVLNTLFLSFSAYAMVVSSGSFMDTPWCLP